MTKTELLKAVHEYVVTAYPTGVHAQHPPLAIGAAHDARAKLFDAIYAWADADRQRNSLGPLRTLAETFDPALVRELLATLDDYWTGRRVELAVQAVRDSERKPEASR